MTRQKKTPKAANGKGSLKWYPTADRYVGQVTRNGKIIKRIYGTLGDQSPAEKLSVEQRLKPYLSLPTETDATATLATLMEAWASRPTLAPASRVSYAKAAKYLVALGRKRLIDVQHPQVLRDAINSITGENGASMARSRQNAHALLRGVFRQAVADRLISYNPMTAVEAPKYEREKDPTVFTPDEQRYLCEAARGTPYEALLLLSLTVPMRTCELLGLRRRDVNLSKREVEVRMDLVETKETGYVPTPGPVKTKGSRRDVPLSDAAAAAFTKLLQAQMAAGRSTPDALVFTASDGSPVRHSNLTRKWWRPVLEAAAAEAEKAARERGDRDYRFPVHAGLYDLRHTAFENMNAAGVPLDVMHKLAGHASVQTSLKHYSRPTEERRRAAVAQVSDWLEGRAVATR